MVIENIKTGKKFDVSKTEYETITESGNSHKYKVVEKDEPLEVKVMRSKTVEVKTKK